MPLIMHDFLKETENGLLLTVYLSRRRSDVEFDLEFGHLEPPEADQQLLQYIRTRYPRLPLSQVRIVTGDAEVVTLPYMSILAAGVNSPE